MIEVLVATVDKTLDDAKIGVVELSFTATFVVADADDAAVRVNGFAEVTEWRIALKHA